MRCTAKSHCGSHPMLSDQRHGRVRTAAGRQSTALLRLLRVTPQGVADRLDGTERQTAALIRASWRRTSERACRRGRWQHGRERQRRSFRASCASQPHSPHWSAAIRCGTARLHCRNISASQGSIVEGVSAACSTPAAGLSEASNSDPSAPHTDEWELPRNMPHPIPIPKRRLDQRSHSRLTTAGSAKLPAL